MRGRGLYRRVDEQILIGQETVQRQFDARRLRQVDFRWRRHRCDLDEIAAGDAVQRHVQCSVVGRTAHVNGEMHRLGTIEKRPLSVDLGPARIPDRRTSVGRRDVERVVEELPEPRRLDLSRVEVEKKRVRPGRYALQLLEICRWLGSHAVGLKVGLQVSLLDVVEDKHTLDRGRLARQQEERGCQRQESVHQE